jgi:hypothetical protein
MSSTTICSLKGRKDELGVSLEKPSNVVYVGRNFNMGGWKLKGSVFQNKPVKKPFEDHLGANLVEYRKDILEKLEKDPEMLKLLMSYKGKCLGCWCSPAPCHASVLRDIIEGYRPGDVLCARKLGRTEKGPKYPIVLTTNGTEYVNIPAFSRGKGMWKTLSPFFLGPIDVTESMRSGETMEKKVTCIENLWQGTKVEARLSREKEGKPPKEEWWIRRNKVWAGKDFGGKGQLKGKNVGGKLVYRHVLKKEDRCHPSEARHYWNGEYLSYEEARKAIYIPEYWKAAEKDDTFKYLVEMRRRSIDFQIVGPDGRAIDPDLGLYGELQVLTKPFGHELVLVAMLLRQRVHEWVERDGILWTKDGKRVVEVVWPKP